MKCIYALFLSWDGDSNDTDEMQGIPVSDFLTHFFVTNLCYATSLISRVLLSQFFAIGLVGQHALTQLAYVRRSSSGMLMGPRPDIRLPK